MRTNQAEKEALAKIKSRGRRSFMQHIRGPSMYGDPSEYLEAQSTEEEADSDSDDGCSFEILSVQYVSVVRGEEQIIARPLAYEMVPEVGSEYRAPDKWFEEINRLILADIGEYVSMHPRYSNKTQYRRFQAVSRLSNWKDNELSKQCNDIPITLPSNTYLDTQVAMAISKMAFEDPLPKGVSEQDVKRYFERTQRKGIEYHRAHNRSYMYLWRKKVTDLRAQTKDIPVEDARVSSSADITLAAATPSPPASPMMSLTRSFAFPASPAHGDDAIDPLLLAAGNRAIDERVQREPVIALAQDSTGSWTSGLFASFFRELF